MKHVLLAGAAALIFAGPAIAKPGNGHGHGNSVGAVGYGVGGCPPGLARKAVPCMPPGQAKKLYNVGQRFPGGYGTLWGYNQIPYDMRSRYGFDPSDRYYYGDGYIYRVDPRTMLIEQAVRAILH
jgi:hypothetical protein